MNHTTFNVSLSSNSVGAPAVTEQMAKEISRITCCNTIVTGYLSFRVEDCAFSGKELKGFIKTAYAIMLKPEVKVEAKP